MPAGRPTLYKPEYADLAYKYCLLGAKNDQLAEFFEVVVSTISLWLVEHQEFSEAVKKGRFQADAEIAHALYHRAKGYSHDAVKIFNDKEAGVTQVPYTEHYPPDTAAAFIWLKNRAGWRDRQEVTGADGKDLIPEAPPITEVARRLAFLLTAGAKDPE